jgi:hypothetical protein
VPFDTSYADMSRHRGGSLSVQAERGERRNLPLVIFGDRVFLG